MKVLRKVFMLGLVSAATLGGIPTVAQADTATVQTGTQEAVVTGNNNQVIQVINQTNYEHPGRGRERRNNGRGRSSNRNTAVVQDAYQGATVGGEGNLVIQETTQENVSHPSRGRGNARGHRR